MSPRRPRTSSRSSIRASRARAGAAALTGAILLLACTKDSGSTEELCQALSQGEGFATVFEDFDPTDAAAALDQLRSARIDLGELKDAAPGEVRDDLEVEIDYVQALIDALEPLADDVDATQVANTIQAVTDTHPGVSDAAATLATFAATSC